MGGPAAALATMLPLAEAGAIWSICWTCASTSSAVTVGYWTVGTSEVGAGVPLVSREGAAAASAGPATREGVASAAAWRGASWEMPLTEAASAADAAAQATARAYTILADMVVALEVLMAG